ncbi:hypothetical protein EFA46_004735 [Halarchaeum sp. CBA1220]|uniref:hypothetical protein n=1 Tax=Halarchaeum sp. CBA1220 TaxID=1853682 RepID=UPI0011CE9185|nr:hypothetical protein [Halarchaeum sp. CBA1220]QLC33533.1 hypothetical protein EFA46_004735 [Halarchaeum sp. CBA1220]
MEPLGQQLAEMVNTFASVAGAGIAQAVLVLVSTLLLLGIGVVSAYLVLGVLGDFVGGGDTGYVDGEPR